MIQIHNKSTYQRIYNDYSTVFIDAYCGYKCNGNSTEESLAAAKISVQKIVSGDLLKDRPNRKMIIKAYDNIRNDAKLIQKAIQYYQSMK